MPAQMVFQSGCKGSNSHIQLVRPVERRKNGAISVEPRGEHTNSIRAGEKNLLKRRLLK